MVVIVLKISISFLNEMIIIAEHCDLNCTRSKKRLSQQQRLTSFIAIDEGAAPKHLMNASLTLLLMNMFPKGKFYIEFNQSECAVHGSFVLRVLAIGNRSLFCQKSHSAIKKKNNNNNNNLETLQLSIQFQFPGIG